jgi:hypothetical protein
LPFLFASAAFVGAYLLFCVQPMIAKGVLPQFGGSPAVWNTCMVFFQVALLAGYAYAYAVSRWLGTQRQALFHLGLLALGIAALPVAVPASTGDGRDPVLRLLGGLLTSAGLPFFVVATTAPLLQRWFSATRHPRAGDPYFLYAASNAGSLLALVTYVTLIEPILSSRNQARLWVIGYGILVVLMIGCARAHRGVPGPEPQPAASTRIEARDRLLWMALAFAPTSLLLAVTSYLTTDLAPVPLLWVIPLALYLLSFILAFSNPSARARRGVALALAPAIVVTLALIAKPSAVPLWATFLIHLGTFFLAATACHIELASRRPTASGLTEFYLMTSLGGALGGLFNALIAPFMFTWVAEYPLGLALAALLVPAFGRRVEIRNHRRWLVSLLDVAIPLLLGGSLYAMLRLGGGGSRGWPLLIPLATCLLFVLRPLRFALGLAAVAVVMADFQDAGRNVVWRERGFFGVLRVSANFPPGMNTLAHGDTIHGMQRRSPIPSLRRVPLMYYFPTGPIGQIFDAYHGTPVVSRVGVVGLGVGSLAGYGMTGHELTFFEIDPAVARIAQDPAFFHYLEDCRARWRVVLGDARMSLGREPDGAFGLIVLDAFNGDAVPVHLLTREALRIYLAKLAAGGLIALHISNNYLDLEPVVRELARDSDLVGMDMNETTIPANEHAQGRMLSHWVILARRRADLARLAARRGWHPLSTNKSAASLWTDDHSDVFGLMRWR